MKPLRYLTLVILCCLFANARAQYVTIPDPVFAAWLQQMYPACMNGSDMDTTCPSITQAAASIQIFNPNLSDLTGIEYFHALQSLEIRGTQLSYLPALDAPLTYIDLGSNQLSSLPDLPAGLETLIINDNYLSDLPALPASLTTLTCGHNPLTSLPALPAGLIDLDCSVTPLLTVMPALPAGLKNLTCVASSVGTLPLLPPNLVHLICGDSMLTSITSPFPDSLVKLEIYDATALNTLPALPPNLTELIYDNGSISVLPALPVALCSLTVMGTRIRTLPALPPSLVYAECPFNDSLTTIPTLPQGLKFLGCGSSNVGSLPPLPASLKTLAVNNSPITSIPQLPDTMDGLGCANTPNLHCLPQLKYIGYLEYYASGISCLPGYGYIGQSNPPLGTTPLCDVFNADGCQVYWNITGNVYNDTSGNCVQQNGEGNTPNVKVKLLQNGNVVQQQYTTPAGTYSFDAGLGDYTITVDTTNIPLDIICPASRFDSVSLTLADSMAYSRNFAMQCKPGFDVGMRGITIAQTTRPASFNTVHVLASDIARIFGAACNAGSQGGQLQITFSGPARFISPQPNALVPVVSGNTLTYAVNDWTTVNNNSFDFKIQVDTNAHAGQQICFNATVTPVAGDNNPVNNQLTQCFTVGASYDPNDKQVSPAAVIDNSPQWLTYTIRFQNTGTAPATHIYVIDTLDAALDAATFQLLAYSHVPLVEIFNVQHRARFSFPNINLADSVHNEPESHGYIQYRIKTLPGLSCGAQIGNAAHIYFDFNAPVATNAAINTIYQSPQTNLQSTICLGEPFVFNGQALTATGDYADTLTGAFGCDSVVLLHLEVLPAYTQNEVATICAGETYTWHNRTLSAAGNYTDTLQASSTCDSVVNLHLQVQPHTETTVNAAACNGDTYSWHNKSFTTAGIYTDTLQTGAGCDSVVLLNLQYYSGNTTNVDVTLTQGDSYTLASGTVLTQPGTYYDTLLTMYGCDSVIILNLNVVAGIGHIPASATMQLYPNPATDMVMINLSDNLTGGTLTLSDVTGRSLNTVPVVSTHARLSTANLSSGVYLVTVVKGDVRVVKRLVVGR